MCERGRQSNRQLITMQSLLGRAAERLRRIYRTPINDRTRF
jgi:hypothetical protein